MPGVWCFRCATGHCVDTPQVLWRSWPVWLRLPLCQKLWTAFSPSRPETPALTESENVEDKTRVKAELIKDFKGQFRLNFYSHQWSQEEFFSQKIKPHLLPHDNVEASTGLVGEHNACVVVIPVGVHVKCHTEVYCAELVISWLNKGILVL